MRIIVISDTHGNFPLALRACEQTELIDVVIHLGDGAEDVDLLKRFLSVEVISVAGNCDHGSPSPRELLWECGNKRLLLVHGDCYGVKSGMGLLEQRARETGVDAVLYGHTHCADISTLSGMLFLNPGTLMISGTPTTYALLEINESSIEATLQHIS